MAWLEFVSFAKESPFESHGSASLLALNMDVAILAGFGVEPDRDLQWAHGAS